MLSRESKSEIKKINLDDARPYHLANLCLVNTVAAYTMTEPLSFE